MAKNKIGTFKRINGKTANRIKHDTLEELIAAIPEGSSVELTVRKGQEYYSILGLTPSPPQGQKSDEGEVWVNSWEDMLAQIPKGSKGELIVTKGLSFHSSEDEKNLGAKNISKYSGVVYESREEFERLKKKNEIYSLSNLDILMPRPSETKIKVE